VAPILTNQLSTQQASVGEAFKFVVPDNTFTNPEGDPLMVTASLADGSQLPDWLSFTAGTFSGTPGRLDTDFYAVRTLSIRVTAQASISVLSAQTTFDLLVGGVSLGQLVVQIVAPIVSVLSSLFALYKARALFLNRYKYANYKPLKETIYPGQFFERQLETPAIEIRVIQATKPPKHQPNCPCGCLTCCCCCFTFLLSSRDQFAKLPSWLEYHLFSNKLVAPKGPHADETGQELIIEVLDEDGVLREQFTLDIRGGGGGGETGTESKSPGTSDSSYSMVQGRPMSPTSSGDMEIQLQPLNR